MENEINSTVNQKVPTVFSLSLPSFPLSLPLPRIQMSSAKFINLTYIKSKHEGAFEGASLLFMAVTFRNVPDEKRRACLNAHISRSKRDVLVDERHNNV